MASPLIIVGYIIDTRGVSYTVAFVGLFPIVESVLIYLGRKEGITLKQNFAKTISQESR